MEREPESIWATTLAAAREALGTARVSRRDVTAIGITNQRDGGAVDAPPGRPLYNAIVLGRTGAPPSGASGSGDDRRERVSCPIPTSRPPSSKWLLATLGRPKGAAFGTVDSWLVHRLRARVTVPHERLSGTMLCE